LSRPSKQQREGAYIRGVMLSNAQNSTVDTIRLHVGLSDVKRLAYDDKHHASRDSFAFSILFDINIFRKFTCQQLQAVI
jgi:hypothetical protein